MNDNGTALEFFNTALALDPNNGEVAHQRGLVYFTMERYEEALNDFDLAFSVEPSDGNHLYYRAIILEKMGKIAAARRTWEVASGLFRQDGKDTKAAECAARGKRLRI
jgi:tetratricopeptide (TPR) repeat protein